MEIKELSSELHEYLGFWNATFSSPLLLDASTNAFNYITSVVEMSM